MSSSSSSSPSASSTATAAEVLGARLPLGNNTVNAAQALGEMPATDIETESRKVVETLARNMPSKEGKAKEGKGRRRKSQKGRKTRKTRKSRKRTVRKYY
jgi:hypothetical protein